MKVPSDVDISGNEKANIVTFSPLSKKMNSTTLSETQNIAQTIVKKKWQKY